MAALGEGVTGLPLNSPLAVLQYGTFSQYFQVDARLALPLKRVDPHVVALLTSGLTASIALEQASTEVHCTIVLLKVQP